MTGVSAQTLVDPLQEILQQGGVEANSLVWIRGYVELDHRPNTTGEIPRFASGSIGVKPALEFCGWPEAQKGCIDGSSPSELCAWRSIVCYIRCPCRTEAHNEDYCESDRIG